MKILILLLLVRLGSWASKVRLVLINKLCVLICWSIFFFSCTKERSCENCKENKAPIALAGPDQIITLPTDSVSLDGSASRDPDGRISEWHWRKISGPASFNIINPSDSIAKVKTLIAGIYQFELKVIDNSGLYAQDTIQFFVKDAAQVNRPPVANAGPDQTINLPVNYVNLDGSASTDPDYNITNYEWKKISGPSPYTFSSANAGQILAIGLVQGVYQFELKVTDAGALNDKDTVQVMVNQEINNSTVDIYVAGMENNLPVYWKNGHSIPLDPQAQGFSGTSIAVVGNDIYIAGTRHELMYIHYAAKYWENGRAIPLGNYAGANSVALSGSDVYVAGWEWESTASGAVAKYWKNGQEVRLTDGTTEANATSIFVIGNDVYVAGDDKGVAKYWKNGQAVSLTDGSHQAYANSIAVVGSDVYVAGSEGNGSVHIAKYWKNGQAVSLTNGTTIVF
jgi:hypothetical protein